MQNVERLLYGKDTTQKIVSIEVNEDQAEVFTEDAGVVSSHLVPNRYWVLLSGNPGSCTRLKGELHYKYGRQFKSREEFQKFKYRYNDRAKAYSIYDAKEALMVKDGYTYFKGMTVNDVSVLSFDLETTGLDPEAEGAHVLLISNTFRSQGKIIKKLFAYNDYSSVPAFLKAWSDWVREKNPSIITGHNISTFDFPYLLKIAEINEFELQLGRDGSAAKSESYESKFRKEAASFINYHKTKIYGREIVDTLFLSIKHDMASRKYESYALKPIIKQEGLEKEGRVFYDASLIRKNYMIPEEWEKIKAYCTDDSDDALALFDLMIKPFFYMSQIVPKSFQTVIESAPGSQLNSILVRSYLQDGYSIPMTSEVHQFQGAISFGIPGIYNNCLRWDLNALYPSIMMTYEIYDKEKDPNSNFLLLVRSLVTTRLEYKKLFKETKEERYESMSNSMKILCNSMYGLLGAPGLNFNSGKCAEAVTQKGREILQKGIKWATGKEYKIETEEEINESA